MNIRFSAAAIGVVLVAFLRGAPAAEISPPTFKWRDAKAAYAKYQAAIDQLDEQYRRGRLAALQAYLATLEASLKAVMAEGNLDEANRINKEITRCRKAMEERTTVTPKPKETPRSFAELAGDWEGRWKSSGPPASIRIVSGTPAKVINRLNNEPIGTIDIREGRFLSFINKTNYWEFLPRQGRLVIMTWPTSADPFATPPIITFIASHPE